MLVLIIMLLSIITTAAVAIAFSTSMDTSTLSIGDQALSVAESGAEDTLLALLRDPSYAGTTQPLVVGNGSAIITVSGSSPLVITSIGTVGKMVRKIQVQANITGGTLSVLSWQEL